MSTRQIHVFISHSWWYSHHYDTLETWIFGQKWSVGQASLDLRDYSVPKHSPIHNAPSDTALRTAIYKQIRMSHVVVIPTGMYANHSKWIRKEIDGAQYYAKPILAVNPWGSLRTSSVVATAATKTVGWNKQPLVNAIWELYRDS
jgi:Thoeris protein ThsB, TIR-like domain